MPNVKLKLDSLIIQTHDLESKIWLDAVNSMNYNIDFLPAIKTVPHHWFSAYYKGNLVGIVSAILDDDKWLIDNLFIDPLYRGNKISILLLNEVLAWATRDQVAHLEANISDVNTPSIKAFLHCGFIKSRKATANEAPGASHWYQWEQKLGKINFPLYLPISLETQRNEIEIDFIKALERLKDFSKLYDWEPFITQSPFIRNARIFDSKNEFDRYIRKIANIDSSTLLPAAFSAALENDEFVAIAPNLYLENYPEGNEDHFYEKLITHEMAHRLHVRILNGEEEKMGPVWFYEGFAIFSANQFEGRFPNLSEREIWQIVDATERGSYLKYSTVMRYFLKRTSLNELIKHAGDSDFNKWLRSLSRN